MAQRASDPYQVLLKTNKLPMSLVRDGQGKNGVKEHQAKIQVESAPFGDTLYAFRNTFVGISPADA